MVKENKCIFYTFGREMVKNPRHSDRYKMADHIRVTVLCKFCVYNAYIIYIYKQLGA